MDRDCALLARLSCVASAANSCGVNCRIPRTRANAHARAHGHGHSHSRTGSPSSASSMDVDGMISEYRTRVGTSYLTRVLAVPAASPQGAAAQLLTQIASRARRSAQRRYPRRLSTAPPSLHCTDETPWMHSAPLKPLPHPCIQGGPRDLPRPTTMMVPSLHNQDSLEHACGRQSTSLPLLRARDKLQGPPPHLLVPTVSTRPRSPAVCVSMPVDAAAVFIYQDHQ